ncbi:hypothetical protein NQ315_005954 [Exocentrus adspersus]|uniref:peptide-methionine (S)-S-oxide reductase n=1 Tax=Exocentrus adspersus TaxID=1586481 RepID=A0AAV8VBK9_9CUCU|nr:hypothetical protein NQ315_005954 [Exocentrus adspersus]
MPRLQCFTRFTFAQSVGGHKYKMPSIVHDATTPFKKATFGMGCFWACDALFGAQQGVLRTRVGDHTEVIEIDYDPKTISYEDLLATCPSFYITTTTRGESPKSHLKKEAHKRNEKLVTEIAPAGAFYPAEDYHQKYRLQAHSWLCEDLGLTPELLQSSHVAARLNGYIVGVGKEDDYEKDIAKLGLSDKIANYVRRHLKENAGGNLYC